MNRHVQIIGGGLAGLTLGIGLRQREVPVTIFEAGHYPRHRVCGEFISGAGLQTLARLGLRQKLEQAGAIAARTAAFFDQHSGTRPLELPEPALCLSRHTLDHLLALEFRQFGGELHEGKRTEVSSASEGIVRATGRRAQPEEGGYRWFGLKAHARGVTLSADSEMHASRQSYVGLCRVEDGVVNVCGLFRRGEGEHVESSRAKLTERLRGEAGSPLQQRLTAAAFDENSICSVAGLSLRPRRAQEHDECCVGDAITMIPPVTGNGMSMAFESAELAIRPLVAWSRAETSWPEASRRLTRVCDTAFSRRLRWASRLQTCAFSPSLQSALLWLVGHSTWCWRWSFRLTR